MYIHREGYKLIASATGIVLLVALGMALWVHPWMWVHYFLVFVMAVMVVLLALFFRIPNRTLVSDKQSLLAPADGRIVTVEDTVENEYIKGECKQVSVFMFGTDVHVNRYPCDGTVEYYQYHRGNYFVASYPKSSDLNEHTSIGIRLDDGQRIVVRQVAGTMARRIVCYAHEGDRVQQNQELGFIKFGSRVDLFVPKHFTIRVVLDQVVKSGIHPLCTINIE